MKLILSRFRLKHLGVYKCCARSFSTISNRTISTNVEVSYFEPLRIISPLSRTFSSVPATFSWRIEGYPTNGVRLECNTGATTKTTNESDEPPSRLFYLELPTELDQDLVYCEVVNNGTLVQQLVLTNCKDGNFLAVDQFNDLCSAGCPTEGKLGDLF